MGRCGGFRWFVRPAGYHLTIIYRSIEKSNLSAISGDKRRPGRPRATKEVPPTDTREAILDVAAQLFASRGYAATGTREIATMVGLRQASLFHYFARKEDLFAELLDRTVSPALSATAWLTHHAGRPEVRLYALAHHDVTNLCGSRHNLAALQLLPEARDDRFAAFWSKRARLRGRYRSLIKDAVRAGRMIDLPVETITDLVFGAVEGTMTWSESSRRVSPTRTADAVASAAVRGVLLKPPSCEDLHAAAAGLRREV
jgi:AcrR family transcriptional regulator